MYKYVHSSNERWMKSIMQSTQALLSQIVNLRSCHSRSSNFFIWLLHGFVLRLVVNEYHNDYNDFNWHVGLFLLFSLPSSYFFLNLEPEICQTKFEMVRFSNSHSHNCLPVWVEGSIIFLSTINTAIVIHFSSLQFFNFKFSISPLNFVIASKHELMDWPPSTTILLYIPLLKRIKFATVCSNLISLLFLCDPIIWL